MFSIGDDSTLTWSLTSGDVGSIKTVIVELTTDTGITGWGEASPWPVFTGTAEGNANALSHYFISAIMVHVPSGAQ